MREEEEARGHPRVSTVRVWLPPPRPLTAVVAVVKKNEQLFASTALKISIRFCLSHPH
ncbi:expressed unknown protein [Ectocarpus siliculosus]|uniref:Uncharacterized protein n=1 Tax=Ectocarpus siliculosus TaxID=2880 RepID=D8LLX2_ECTSI|nr:expressed unknown protein [Ectocarpus siliculosus]|eukprot:CBN77186.1 expressed unknown protein [Ectocarpus siliculosus]